MKIALVTGANRGIGLAVARRLARDGIHVVVAARSDDAGRAAADLLRSEGGRASSVRLDVTDPEQARAAAAVVAQQLGRLDVLVNNAGVLPEATARPAEVVDAGLFRATYDTNVLGPVVVTEAFLPLLRRSPAGRIVNVSSRMGSLADQQDPASPYYSTVVPAYQSSKAALNGLTVALAKALADTPIKVTSVCPGFVQTDLAPIAREQAPLTADAAAEVVHRAATLSGSAPSGTFVDAVGPVPW
ncbi:SDR family NAD(P)-dependent oxidoreductase [Isoptericola cucumis]|uniref:SDR family NAD(P)-dependent oxidoreductase n=1 Tax=Isoptericola cucumis TaxID=1776856 RepID=UPI003209FFE2